MLSLVILWAAFELGGARPYAYEFAREGWEVSPGLRFSAEVRDLRLQLHHEGVLYATRAESVFVSSDRGGTWDSFGRLEPRDYGSSYEYGRALRSSRVARAFWRGEEIDSLLPLDSGTLLALYPPWIQRSVDGGRSWRRVQRLDSDPERDVRLVGVQDVHGSVWIALPDSGGPSRLLRGTKDGLRWDEVEVVPFKAGASGASLVDGREENRASLPGPIRSLHLDPLRQRVWLTTSGDGPASQVGWLEENGRFRRASGGGDGHRTSGLLFTASHVYWASDLPEGPFGIWSWSRVHDRVEKVAELPGPAQATGRLADGTLLIATRSGPGGLPDLDIWASRDAVAWTSLFRTRLREAVPGRSMAAVLFALGDPLADLAFSVRGFGFQKSAILLTRGASQPAGDSERSKPTVDSD
ncbi:MAG: hypothetical protein VX498_05570 [Myxococcota bacterium]|nr:hypothetical protein [Myxococcota bacterium]